MMIQWTRLRKKTNSRTINQRYAKTARKLIRAAESTRELSSRSSDWSASLYKLPDQSKVVTAMKCADHQNTFIFIHLYFPPEITDNPKQLLKLITSSIRLHDEDVVPWSIYDVSFELPREFRLRNTSLQAGRKLMVFEWRLRRFYIWHFALADILLKNCQPNLWAAQFLNACKHLKGPTFSATENGPLLAKRSRRYPLGHFEEIGRYCFLYQAQCIHDPAKNSLILWVYNYRNAEDLKKIPASLNPH